MKYPFEERRQIAAAFRAAKSRLARDEADVRNGRERFICFALAMARHAASDDASRIVGDRLGRSYSLGGWLKTHGVEEREITLDRLQAHRHAWLDLLIKEFEGDCQ